MLQLRILTLCLVVLLAAAVLPGCGKQRHSRYSEPPAAEIRVKGQVDAGVESSRGF